MSPEDKKAFGPWAFVGSALDVVREYKSKDTRLVLDGQPRQVKTSLIVVSNVQLYGGVLPIGAQACVDDGLPDVCVFKTPPQLTIPGVCPIIAVLGHSQPVQPCACPRALD